MPTTVVGNPLARQAQPTRVYGGSSGLMPAGQTSVTSSNLAMSAPVAAPVHGYSTQLNQTGVDVVSSSSSVARDALPVPVSQSSPAYSIVNNAMYVFVSLSAARDSAQPQNVAVVPSTGVGNWLPPTTVVENKDTGLACKAVKVVSSIDSISGLSAAEKSDEDDVDEAQPVPELKPVIDTTVPKVRTFPIGMVLGIGGGALLLAIGGGAFWALRSSSGGEKRRRPARRRSTRRG